MPRSRLIPCVVAALVLVGTLPLAAAPTAFFGELPRREGAQAFVGVVLGVLVGAWESLSALVTSPEAPAGESENPGAAATGDEGSSLDPHGGR